MKQHIAGIKSLQRKQNCKDIIQIIVAQDLGEGEGKDLGEFWSDNSWAQGLFWS